MGTGKLYLLIAWDFVKTGGMEVANHALASYFAASGAEVHLLGASASNDLTSKPNVTFHPIRTIGRSMFLNAPFLDLAGRRLAAQISERGGKVLVNGGNCRWGDINWVHYVHAAYRPISDGNVFWRYKWKWAHSRFLRDEREALDQAKVIIANSKRTKRDLIEHLGIEAERIQTVYLGIDAEQFQPPARQRRQNLREAFGWPEDRPIVVFAGGLGDQRKGFDTLFSAWRRLCADLTWNADLIVVGKGSSLKSWEACAASEGLAQRIRFLGFRQDVPDILAAADALVSPTRYESYGLAVQEAICCGLAAFVSKDAGVAERYPRSLDHLLITDPNDAEELAQKLRQWVGRRDGYRAKVIDLSKTLRRHTWMVMAAQMESLMEPRAEKHILELDPQHIH